MTTQPIRTATTRRIARLARISVLALALAAAGTTALGTGNAQAAGVTTKPDVYACLTWGGTTYANQPVYLDRWNASTGKWETARSTTTNSSGCVRFNDLSVGYYFEIVGYKAWPELSYYYYGESPYFYTSANDYLFRYSVKLTKYYW